MVEEEHRQGKSSSKVWSKFKHLKTETIKWEQHDLTKWRKVSFNLISDIGIVDAMEEDDEELLDLRKKKSDSQS